MNKLDILIENLSIKCMYIEGCDNICTCIENPDGYNYCNCDGDINKCEIKEMIERS